MNSTIAFRLASLAAFLLPALALWVPSGYSYAAVLLLLGALCLAPRWLRRRPEPEVLWLAALFAGMGCMWFLLALDPGVARWDKGSKWLLAVPCLFFLAAYPPRPRAFMAGLPIGCLGMGALAAWQTWGRHLPRAEGFTNAIQWGNTALLLACMTVVCVVVFWRVRPWPWRLGMVLAALAGLGGSLLSQSRGGWLALLLVFPMWLMWCAQIRPHRLRAALAGLAALATVLALVLGLTPRFHGRIALAASEIAGFLNNGQGENSLGVRLQQYELATDMIAHKPWLGWGAHGFVSEMNRRVEAGEYGPLLHLYPEVHNIFLDAWVKVGILGLLLQLALLGYVLYLFWPSPGRLQHWREDSDAWRDALALRAMGCLVPVCFLMFGMSQPFFNHNSGIMVFAFYTMVLWAALRGLERGVRA